MHAGQFQSGKTANLTGFNPALQDATYSSYLLERMSLTWGMRSTQQPSDKHGASVWRLMREEKEKE